MIDKKEGLRQASSGRGRGIAALCAEYELLSAEEKVELLEGVVFILLRKIRAET